MKGAPAKPMRGTVSSAASRRTASACHGQSSSGTSGRSRARSASVRKGCSTTGPTPVRISTPKPMAATGATMSE